jgi:hypothetical protein
MLGGKSSASSPSSEVYVNVTVAKKHNINPKPAKYVDGFIFVIPEITMRERFYDFADVNGKSSKVVSHSFMIKSA